MPTDPTGGREMLAAARDRCRRLIDDLRREAAELARPCRLVKQEALAEGRAAYLDAAVSAEHLLRLLEESLADAPLNDDDA
jgi:hypothetical protein